MPNYACVLLVCILYVGGGMGCQMLVELDSNQGWRLRGDHIQLLGGREYLTAPSDVKDRLVLQREPSAASGWSYRDGMVINRFYKQVISVESDFVVLTNRGTPPAPSQKFEYINGTLWNRETDLYLTGWGKELTVTMETRGGGCKQRTVILLMNEQWALVGNQLMSALTGLVLTRKHGQAQLYALPYNATDKSLHQHWYWESGKLINNGDSVLTALTTGEALADISKGRGYLNQLFYLSNGFIRNLINRKAMYIPKDGSGIQFRKEHVYS